MFDGVKARTIGLPYGEKTMTLSRFHLIPERHGWTDERTDRRTELLYQYQQQHLHSHGLLYNRCYYIGVNGTAYAKSD